MALESIALIPSGYKATKVYSQLPVNGNGDFTFDRGTSTDQTRVNKNGLIESVAQDVPRLDYLDGGCPSLLLEPATTNLITYSEEFDNVAWVKVGGSVSANALLSPDGSVNADRFTEDSASSTHRLQFTSSDTTTTGTRTASFFFKKTGKTYLSFSMIYATNSRGAGVVIDLSTNEVIDESTSSATYSVKVVDYGNDWVRVSMTATNTVDNIINRLNISAYDSGSYSWDLPSKTPIYTGNGVNYIDVFGAQEEIQSYATSYVRSLAGVSGVRNVETALTSAIINEVQDLQGSIFMESKSIEGVGVFQGVGELSVGGSVDNSIRFLYSPTSLLRAIYRVGAVSEFDVSIPFVDLENYTKVAIEWDNGNVKFYANGLLVSSQSGVTMLSGIDTLTLNNRYRLKKLSVYDDTTTDLEALTGFTSFAEMASYLSYS